MKRCIHSALSVSRIRGGYWASTKQTCAKKRSFRSFQGPRRHSTPWRHQILQLQPFLRPITTNKRQRPFSTSNSSIPPHISNVNPQDKTYSYDDGWNHWRCPPSSLTKQQIAYLKANTEQTDQAIRQRHSELYETIVQEIEQAQAKLIPPPERGPSGRYSYEMAVIPTSDELGERRVYRRYDLETCDTQIVLEFDPSHDILSMSINGMDETCLAFISQSVLSGNVQLNLQCMKSGKQTVVPVPNSEVMVSCEWGAVVPAIEENLADSNGPVYQSIYYVTVDSTMARPHQVYGCLIDLTTLQMVGNPTLVFESTNPAEIVDVQRAKGCQHVVVQSRTKTSSFVALNHDPRRPSTVVLENNDEDGQFPYHVDVGDNGEVFIIVTPPGEDSTIIRTTTKCLPLSAPTVLFAVLSSSQSTSYLEDPSKFQIVARSSVSLAITNMDIFQSHIVVYRRSTKTGEESFKVIPRESKPERERDASVVIPMPPEWNECWTISPLDTMTYTSSRFSFSIEAPFSPPRYYSYNFESQDLESHDGFRKNPDLPSQYRSNRVFVESHDGTKVPMSLFYSQSQLSSDKTKGSSLSRWLGFGQPAPPFVLNGYGAYGEPQSLKFDPSALSLLDRGVVLAYAHVRGEGDKGQKWYHKGRQKLKKNSIEDYLACARALKTSNILLSDDFIGGGSLTAKAFSAGGVTVGQAISQDPALFDKAVMTNAFFDLLATMLNPNLYLTEHEYEEFGYPQTSAKDIQALCPVSNVVPGASYPQFLIMGAMDDAQVPFHNALIMTAKLRECALEGREDRVLLHIESTGGHHLAGCRHEVSALESCFILDDPNSL